MKTVSLSGTPQIEIQLKKYLAKKVPERTLSHFDVGEREESERPGRKALFLCLYVYVYIYEYQLLAFGLLFIVYGNSNLHVIIKLIPCLRTSLE